MTAKKKKKKPKHLIIPDAQVKKGVPTNHLKAAANYAVEHQFDNLINLGDFWDMPSLSSYDSMKSAEGKRVMVDVEAGNSAMQDFMNIIVKGRKQNKKWIPTLDYLTGNHEQRIERAVGSNPKLEGVIGYHLLNLGGWKVHNFLDIALIDGVHYSHYFANPMSGKAYGGNANNMLAKLGFSFVQGHRQSIEYARKDLNNGKSIQGLIVGAFYQHDEEYKGPQGNGHFRGIVALHDVENGNFDHETISMERLLREYL